MDISEKDHKSAQNREYAADPDDAAAVEESKRLMRRADFRLLPMLCSLYLVSFLDRGNIGNAKVAGLQKDLNLTGTQYNIALTIFFIPYAILEVPSNMMLKFLKPKIWIPLMMLAWGTTMTLMGLVQNYTGIVLARLFLGVGELRCGILYSISAAAGAFSGLLAFAIEKMDGIGGLAGWRWIFILEGLLTVVLAMIAPWFLPEDPSQARFFNREEKETMLRILKLDFGRDTAETAEPYKHKYLFAALRDWKLYASVLVYWGNAMPIYGFIYTLPSTIHGLGYSASNAQLLTIPVYTVAVITTLTSSYYSDKTKTRSMFIAFPLFVAAVGFIIILALPKDRWPGAIYGMLFVIAIGLYTTIPGVVAWIANNLAGSWKRAIGMGIVLSFGNLGGAVGTNIYLQKQAPHYQLGYGFSIAITLVGGVAALLLRTQLARINARRDLISEEDIRAKYTDEELREMGDASPLFRYTT